MDANERSQSHLFSMLSSPRSPSTPGLAWLSSLSLKQAGQTNSLPLWHSLHPSVCREHAMMQTMVVSRGRLWSCPPIRVLSEFNQHVLEMIWSTAAGGGHTAGSGSQGAVWPLQGWDVGSTEVELGSQGAPPPVHSKQGCSLISQSSCGLLCFPQELSPV